MAPRPWIGALAVLTHDAERGPDADGACADARPGEWVGHLRGVLVIHGGGRYQYVIYPGAVETQAAANYEVQGTPLPRTWRVNLVDSGGGSWTYSLGYTLVV